jgi:hypothetical protein
MTRSPLIAAGVLIGAGSGGICGRNRAAPNSAMAQYALREVAAE